MPNAQALDGTGLINLNDRPAYRALILAPDGQVLAAENLLVLSDQDAMALAKAMVNGHAVELWDGVRYMERFDVEGWGS